MDEPSSSGYHNKATNVQKKRVDCCFVPMCPSTSAKFPNKIFLTGPSDPKLREKWFKAARRSDIYSSKTIIRCCEDHFDLENDVENWVKYKLCGGKLFLKKDVVPHIFACQNRMMPMKPRSVINKRKRREILESIENIPDIRGGEFVPLHTDEPCDILCYKGKNCCDNNAICTCGILTGHYTCLCKLGFYGSGLNNSCSPCPPATYSDGPNVCLPCPDINHITQTSGIGIESCKCKAGYQKTKDNKCEVIRCPKLEPPQNGYFIKKKVCGSTLNTACGVRCITGYILTGSSIRLCQKNGTWSGLEPRCLVKTCPFLLPPSDGNIRCFNSDVGILQKNFKNRFPVDTVCKFECKKGRVLIGSSHRTCLPIAEWDGLPTSCKKVNCNKLSKILHGRIEPKSCTRSKQPYGKTCKFICEKGFNFLGPKEITCTGRSWNKKRQSIICKDITPPIIICPQNIVGFAMEGVRFGLVSWEEPIAIDNSGLPVKIWLYPSIRHTKNVKFRIGVTHLTYYAEDSFKNEANCTFSICIKDNQPPQVENCFDPPPFVTPKVQVNITWDEPNFYDNSGFVKIVKSREFGIFELGTTQVIYTARDLSNNTNTCILNITVQDNQCDPLPDPQNGRSLCKPSHVSTESGMQCVVTCDDGFALPLDSITENFDSIDTAPFFCSDDDPFFYYSAENIGYPGCTITVFPANISLHGIFNIQPEDETEAMQLNCDEKEFLKEMKNDIQRNLFEVINLKDIDTNITCEKYISVKEEMTNIIKRDTICNRKSRDVDSTNIKNKKLRSKIKVYFKVNKLHNISHYDEEHIRTQLKNIKVKGKKRFNVSSIKINKKIVCPKGSMKRRQKCVTCPLGTYKENNRNSCQNCPIGTYNDNYGQTSCKMCPKNFSTNKVRSKSFEDCKEHCPPGTIAKIKMVKLSKYSNNTIEHVTLMPFCQSCPYGFYQGHFGKISCIPCPKYFTTLYPQSDSVEKCVPTSEKICMSNPNVCNVGKCVPLNEFFYKCECMNGSFGSNCEKSVNSCDSNPCLNGGHCLILGSHDSDGYVCHCPNEYSGNNCEEIEEICNRICYNNGSCTISDDGSQFCECLPGFGGDACEFKIIHCREDLCENNATCKEEQETFNCICKGGFIGKRCNILPCDYLPCGSHQLCIDLIENNTTNLSFKCECPSGFEGEKCDKKIDYCLKTPCQNGGECISLSESFRCVCGAIFTGQLCETKLESDYLMYFSQPTTNNFVQLEGFAQTLKQVSVCLWMKTSDSFNYGTIFSYATAKFDNSFTLMDYTGLVLYINNQYVITDIFLNDGVWHFLCITWNNSGNYNIFVDGRNVTTGHHLAVGSEIEDSGILIIGQEQDSFGGMFSQTEAFVGKITSLNFWKEQLSPFDVIKIMTSCKENFVGDLYSWPQMKNKIRGNILIENSSFCSDCSSPPPLPNGIVKIENFRAFYYCSAGYYLFPNIYSSGRRCLKTQQWEGTINPTCKKIYCGYPGHLDNGRVLGKRFFYKDKVKFWCFYGYKIHGLNESVCTENGTWSSQLPHCIDISGKTSCNLFKIPEGANISLITEISQEIPEKTYFESGEKIEIHCNESTSLKGNKILTCIENGSWDNAPPSCDTKDQKLCSVDNLPQTPQYGLVIRESLTEYINGSQNTVFFKCRIGFELIGKNYTLCINDGYWTSLNMSCKPLECSSLPVFPKMIPKINSSSFVVGKTVSYGCLEGFKIFGNSIIRCLPTTKWSKMQGKCVKISCYKPKVSDLTIIEGNSYLFEDKITLTCPEGKKYLIKCSSNGQWEGEIGNDC